MSSAVRRRRDRCAGDDTAGSLAIHGPDALVLPAGLFRLRRIGRRSARGGRVLDVALSGVELGYRVIEERYRWTPDGLDS